MLFINIDSIRHLMTNDEFSNFGIIIIIDNIKCYIEFYFLNHKYHMFIDTVDSLSKIILLKNIFKSPQDMMKKLDQMKNHHLIPYDDIQYNMKIISLSNIEYNEKRISKRWATNKNISFKCLKKIIKTDLKTCYVCLEDCIPLKIKCNHTICIYCFDKYLHFSNNFIFECGICRQKIIL